MKDVDFRRAQNLTREQISPAHIQESVLPDYLKEEGEEAKGGE